MIDTANLIVMILVWMLRFRLMVLELISNLVEINLINLSYYWKVCKLADTLHLKSSCLLFGWIVQFMKLFAIIWEESTNEI